MDLIARERFALSSRLVGVAVERPTFIPESWLMQSSLS